MIDRDGVKDGFGTEFQLPRVAHTSEEAGTITFMTGAADLAVLDQDDVAITVEPDRLDVLHVP